MTDVNEFWWRVEPETNRSVDGVLILCLMMSTGHFTQQHEHNPIFRNIQLYTEHLDKTQKWLGIFNMFHILLPITDYQIVKCDSYHIL